jgi:hypothetical protein
MGLQNAAGMGGFAHNRNRNARIMRNLKGKLHIRAVPKPTDAATFLGDRNLSNVVTIDGFTPGEFPTRVRLFKATQYKTIKVLFKRDKRFLDCYSIMPLSANLAVPIRTSGFGFRMHLPFDRQSLVHRAISQS